MLSGFVWPSAAGAAPATVTITDAVSPAEVTVAPGETVPWRNSDSTRHRMRSTSGPGDFDTGDIEPGESVTFRFSATGTYSYRDERDDENPRYQGRVIVRGDAPPPSGGGTGGGGTGGGGAAPSAASVSIVDRAFSPASISVAVGGTVTWTNNDDRGHTATADNGAFASPTLNGGGRFSHTFTTPGTFAYFCELHPEMRGVVAVGQSGGAPPPPPPSAPPASAPPTGGGPTRPGGPAAVTIVDSAFNPASLEIAVGTTVNWTNAGRARHTATADNGAFDSGDLAAGGRFSYTFATPGTYAYKCEIHPEMRGVIGVGAAPPPVAAGPPPDGAVVATRPPCRLAVNVADYSFQPQQVTAAVGDTVSWRNVGAAPHTVTADDNSFDSGNLAPGASFERIFTAGGTFSYFCAIHPEMKGVVNVGPAGTAAPPPPPESPPQDAGAAAGSASVKSATVKMKDYRFDPERLTVGVGAEVTWKHDGRAPHTATADDGTFDSGEIDDGKTFAYRFEKVGTFEYICTIHPRMRGVVEVVADANVEPTGASASGLKVEHIAFAAIAGSPLLFLGSAMLATWRSKLSSVTSRFRT